MCILLHVSILLEFLCPRLGASVSQVGSALDTSKVLVMLSALQQKITETHTLVAPPGPPPSEVPRQALCDGEIASDQHVEERAEAEDVTRVEEEVKAKKQSLPRPVATPARVSEDVLEKLRKMREGKNLKGDAEASEAPSGASRASNGANSPAPSAPAPGLAAPIVGDAVVVINTATHKKEYMRLAAWLLVLMPQLWLLSVFLSSIQV